MKQEWRLLFKFNFQPYGSKVTIETKMWLVKIVCKARMKSEIADTFAGEKEADFLIKHRRKYEKNH